MLEVVNKTSSFKFALVVFVTDKQGYEKQYLHSLEKWNQTTLQNKLRPLKQTIFFIHEYLIKIGTMATYLQ